MTLQWISCDLRTGDVMLAVPGLLVDYPVRRTLGAYDTATAHMVIEGTGPPFDYTDGPSPDPSMDWWYASIPGKNLFACYDDEDVDQTIQWAGFVTARTRNGETNVVDLSLATIEAYTDRRFINADMTYSGVGQNTIFTDLANRHLIEGGVGAEGLPLTVVYVPGGAVGALIEQDYRDADLTSCYEVFTGLAALDTGPEWEMRWSWRSGMGGLICTLYVGDRIGIASSSPAAVFEMPGSIISVQYTEDYSSGKGANSARAYTDTMGVAPSAFEATVDPYGRPRYNYQFQAPAGITRWASLNRLATRASFRMRNGAHTVQLVADRRTAPVFCRDWNLGDDIGYQVGNTSLGQDYIPVFPFTHGLTGHQRVIAVEIGEDTIAPIAIVDNA